MRLERRAVRPHDRIVIGSARRLQPMLDIGTQAPDFTLPDQDGNPVQLSDLRGQTVVVYFYPKADTPGY